MTVTFAVFQSSGRMHSSTDFLNIFFQWGCYTLLGFFQDSWVYSIGTL